MFARTKRLTLRPGWPEDAPALHAAIAHEAVAMRLSNVPWPYRPADAESFLLKQDNSTGLFHVILAHDRPSPELVGGINLQPSEDVYVLGYWLTPSAWSRGYMTEAGRAVLDNARFSLQARQFSATWLDGNEASRRVLEKLGFSPSGRTVTQHSLALGRDVEAVEMRLAL